MKKIIILLIVLLVSIPIQAKTPKPIFIGDFNPVLKDSVLSKFYSGMYDVFFETFNQGEHHLYCNDSLWNIGDTISGCDWSNIPWSDSLASVILPNFPDCPVTVHYRIKICPNNSLIRQIDIINFYFEFEYYDECQDLADYLNTGNNYEQAMKNREIDEQLYYLVSQHEAEQMSAIPPCDSIGNYLPQYVFHHEVACIGKIKLYVEYHSKMDIYYEDLTCMEDGCCKRAISFCQDSLGNIQTNILTNESVGRICVGYPTEFDIENTVALYHRKYPNAVRITYDIFPCLNVCD